MSVEPPSATDPRTPADGADRRHDPRVATVSLVQISPFDSEGLQQGLAAGRTINISRGGVRLEMHQPLAVPLRSRLRLDVALGDALVTVEGIIVYLEAVDEQRTHVGVAFDELEPALAQRLDALVTGLGG
ncbi:MAG: PilZ domain-containing protein [Acidobacteriota bacterium]